ncbi:MAG: hypothetical protein MN733_33730 [Nitrososphaera sp.]|nr:hypothetical protein [Nitrososphaera sp.]
MPDLEGHAEQRQLLGLAKGILGIVAGMCLGIVLLGVFLHGMFFDNFFIMAELIGVVILLISLFIKQVRGVVMIGALFALAAGWFIRALLTPFAAPLATISLTDVIKASPEYKLRNPLDRLVMIKDDSGRQRVFRTLDEWWAYQYRNSMPGAKPVEQEVKLFFAQPEGFFDFGFGATLALLCWFINAVVIDKLGTKRAKLTAMLLSLGAAIFVIGHGVFRYYEFIENKECTKVLEEDSRKLFGKCGDICKSKQIKMDYTGQYGNRGYYYCYPVPGWSD